MSPQRSSQAFDSLASPESEQLAARAASGTSRRATVRVRTGMGAQVTDCWRQGESTLAPYRARHGVRPAPTPSTIRGRLRDGGGGAGRLRGPRGVGGAGMTTPSTPDLWADDAVDVRRVQPYEARKAYVCPGCHREIPAGTGHVVAVPHEAPDLRRHWHRGCWDRRHRRR